MQVFDKTNRHHHRRTGQSEEEQDLKKMHDSMSEEGHDAHSIVR